MFRQFLLALLQRKQSLAAQPNPFSIFLSCLYLYHLVTENEVNLKLRVEHHCNIKDTQYSDHDFRSIFSSAVSSSQGPKPIVPENQILMQSEVQTDWNTGSDIRLTQKVPAGHNLLNLDAGGSHRNDKDLIVPWRKMKGIIQYLSADIKKLHFCANNSPSFISAWTTGWALWWWLEAFQLPFCLHSE